ncbi:hypothetical protein JAO29_17735 [Edaphobacter sp. HDX4]
MPVPGTSASMGQVPYPPYPPVLAPPRVQRHLQTLGTLWCVYGAYRVISGLIGFFFVRAITWRHFGSNWPLGGWGIHHGPPWPWMALMPVLLTTAVVMAALALFAGLSLLNRKPHGRLLAIVLGILALFKFPLGTALGIYTLWVLAPTSSAVEYEAVADRS